MSVSSEDYLEHAFGYEHAAGWGARTRRNPAEPRRPRSSVATRPLAPIVSLETFQQEVLCEGF